MREWKKLGNAKIKGKRRENQGVARDKEQKENSKHRRQHTCRRLILLDDAHKSGDDALALVAKIVGTVLLEAEQTDRESRSVSVCLLTPVPSSSLPSQSLLLCL